MMISKKITEVTKAQSLSEDASILITQPETVNGTTQERLRRLPKRLLQPQITAGEGLYIDGQGRICLALPYAGALGGIKVGDGLNFNMGTERVNTNINMARMGDTASQYVFDALKLGYDRQLYICKRREIAGTDPEIGDSFTAIYLNPSLYSETYDLDDIIIPQDQNKIGTLYHTVDGYISDSENIPSDLRGMSGMDAYEVLSGSGEQGSGTDDDPYVWQMLCKCHYFEYDNELTKTYTGWSLGIVTEERADYDIMRYVDDVYANGAWYIVSDSAPIALTINNLNKNNAPEGLFSVTERFEYYWDNLFDLPAASSSTLGGIKVGAGLNMGANGELSVLPSTPDFVYECTGTADDTAIAALIDAFFATDKTSYRLDIIGDFGGTGTLTIAPQTDKKQSVYLNFAGCNTGSTLETVTITITGDTSVHISNLKSYEAFIFVLNGTGYKFFDNCELTGAGTPGQFLYQYITNNSGSNLYICNCKISQNSAEWNTTRFFTNYGDTIITNSKFSGKYSNESGRLQLTNCVDEKGDITNKSLLLAANSQLSGDWKSAANAEWRLTNCKIYGAYNYVYIFRNLLGFIYLSNCWLRGGNSGNGTSNTFSGNLLIMDNCILATGTNWGDATLISCTTPTAKVKITNCHFESHTNNYSDEYGRGGLILGTDNATIPKFYLSGNSFDMACASIGGNDVTYATADNDHYMPEFANTFTTIKVTFNANGGTVDPATKQVYLSRPYGDLPIPTKADSTFEEWNTAQDGTGTTVTSTTTVSSTAAHTLYAIWTEVTT